RENAANSSPIQRQNSFWTIWLDLFKETHVSPPYQSFVVSSTKTRPEYFCTVSYICSVPPGPSPPLRFHKQIKRTLSGPRERAACSCHRLFRAYGLASLGVGPSSSGITSSLVLGLSFT